MPRESAVLTILSQLPAGGVPTITSGFGRVRELSRDCCALANVTPDPHVPVKVSDAKGALSFCWRPGTAGRRRRAVVTILICWLIVEPTPFITFSDGRFNFLVFGYFTGVSPDLHASFLRNRSPLCTWQEFVFFILWTLHWHVEPVFTQY